MPMSHRVKDGSKTALSHVKIFCENQAYGSYRGLIVMGGYVDETGDFDLIHYPVPVPGHTSCPLTEPLRCLRWPASWMAV